VALGCEVLLSSVANGSVASYSLIIAKRPEFFVVARRGRVLHRRVFCPLDSTVTLATLCTKIHVFLLVRSAYNPNLRPSKRLSIYKSVLINILTIRERNRCRDRYTSIPSSDESIQRLIRSGTPNQSYIQSLGP